MPTPTLFAQDPRAPTGAFGNSAARPHQTVGMHAVSVSPAAYRRVTLVALVALGAIVVTGAAVRLTGSGLGCPEWPNCDAGHLTPHGSTGYHGAVEFVNRTFTGLVSVLVILAVLGSLVRTPRRRDLTWLAVGLVVGV